MANARVFISIIFVFLAVSLMSRAEILPFKNYTITDGLAHDRVNRIVRDSRGFLWFCTSEGLSRFDGYEFKNYTRDRGLPHRTVTDFLETRNGNLWIATGDGLVLFDPKGIENPGDTGSPPMFRILRPGPEKIKNKTWYVADLLEDSKGMIWAASSEGLYRVEAENGTPALRRIDRDNWGLGSIDFQTIAEDASGAMWLGLVPGLARLLPDESIQIMDPKLRVGSLLADRQGRVWVGTQGGESKGLHLYDLSGGKPRLSRSFGKQDGLASDHWMNALMETADGRIYVGVGNGLSELVSSPDVPQPAFRQISVNDVVSVAQDINGNVWMGTGSSGAFRLALHGFTAFGKNDGLTDARITSIMAAPDGEVYITAGDTIFRFDDGKFTGVKPMNTVKINWGLSQLTLQDKSGEWWLPGTIGLQRYPKVARLDDLAKTPPARLYTTADGLFNNSVFHLFEDSRGDIWISIIYDPERSLMRFERATGKIFAYTPGDGIAMPYSCPTAFAEDHAGNIWFGFYAGGLIRYRGGKFEMFTGGSVTKSGMIRDLHIDGAGRLWTATSTNGLVRTDDPTADQPEFQSMTTKEGLSSNQVSCITEDRKGRIYAGTGRGVSQIDLPTGRIKHFNTSDGLSENLVNVCEADKDGALWFGTNNGLARYVPFEEAENAPLPIFIGGIRANGTDVRRISERGESEIASLDLASDQRQVQIDFLALGFASGESLKYQYKFASDAEWGEPTLQRTVNLTLAPGSYQFQVRAVSADGRTSEAPASVAFRIASPVWQRWWFLALAAIVIGFAVYFVYRYRLMQMVKLERVRTRIASDLHDDIGASLSQISILSEVAQRKAGDSANGVVEPLSMIAGTSRSMMESMSDIVWAINPKKDHLSDLLQRMRRFAEDILDAQEIEHEFIAPENARNITLGADLRREIYLAFKESVNNLVKHSRATDARIEITLSTEGLSIEIKDNGRGFEQDSGVVGFGGNGLVNIRRRMENVKGECVIESAPGKGTRVTLKVPVGKGIFGAA